MLSPTLLLIFSLSSISCCIAHRHPVDGTTARGWEFVRDLFSANFEQGEDLGASVAIYHQGQLVVDLKGGWFDQSETRPYDDDTLQLVFSTTKGLVAVAVALCVQRGLLDYSALVTTYWPEYGQNGKEKTTVADLLSHRAGLPYIASPIAQYINWTAMVQTLAEEKPLWPPGTTHGYHAVTYGWLAGELVRRVDPLKRSFGRFVKEEIADRLQIEFYVGLPPELQHRVSPVVPLPHVKDGLNATMLNYFQIWNDPHIHQAEIPAAIGMSNARSVARLYASLIADVEGPAGQRLLTEEMMKRATERNTPLNEIDLVFQYYSVFGIDRKSVV